MEEKKNRDNILDIMKGVSILLVVLGHTYNPFCHNFIYLFHVAIFYIISGYFFNPSYVESKHGLFLLLKKRILSLWVPYVSYNFLALLCQNFFLKIGFLTTNQEAYNLLGCYLPDGCNTYVTLKTAVLYILKSFCFMNSRPFAGGLWFLGGLFFVTFLYSLIQFILVKFNHGNLHIFLSIFFLILGFLFECLQLPAKISLFKQVDIILISEIMFTIGTLIKKYNVINLLKNMKSYLKILIASISLLILIIVSNYGTISIAARNIINPLFYLAVSIVGFVFIFYISLGVDKFFILNTIYIYIGKHTIPILALHTLAFKIVTIMEWKIYDTEKIVLSAYPVWKNSFVWTIAYLFAGLFIPILVTYPISKVKILKKVFVL